jgi:hypothetical protein
MLTLTEAVMNKASGAIAEKIHKIVHPPTRPSIYANDEKLREAVNQAFAVTAPEDPQMWEDVT